ASRRELENQASIGDGGGTGKACVSTNRMFVHTRAGRESLPRPDRGRRLTSATPGTRTRRRTRAGWRRRRGRARGTLDLPLRHFLRAVSARWGEARRSFAPTRGDGEVPPPRTGS